MLDWMTRGLFLAQADGAGDEGATGVEVTAPDGGEAAITVEGGDVDVTVEGGGAEDAPPITLEAVQQDAMNAWEGLMAGDVGAAMPLVERYLIPAGMALLILVVGYFVAKFLSRLASAPVKMKVDETLGKFTGKLVFYVLMIFVFIAVLGRVGVEVTSFAAIMAAAGFAIGLAFQGTLSNFASGVLLLVFRPFKVGDVINAAGITAKVYEIDLFTTTFDTPDNRRIVVPNSSIAGGTIENITFHGQRRLDVAVGVDYSADIDKTREVLTAAAESLKDATVQGDGRGYQIVLGDLGDSAVNWTVRMWVNAGDFWPTKEALTRAVKMHLDEAGIGIPFPQMDVHVIKDGDG